MYTELLKHPYRFEEGDDTLDHHSEVQVSKGNERSNELDEGSVVEDKDRPTSEIEITDIKRTRGRKTKFN